MSKNLYIYIDAFPFNYLNRTKFLSKFPIKLKLVPGFGFSVNLKAELFAGCVPDEIGFFNEWNFDPEKSARAKLKVPDLFLNSYNRIYFFDRVLHVLYRFFRKPIGNIPFNYIDLFKRENKDIYSRTFPKPTLFSSAKSLNVILSEKYQLDKGERDCVGVSKARELIDRGKNVFLSLIDLDSISHAYGVGSPQHELHIKKLDNWCRELIEEFQKRHKGRGNVVIFSDHGMENVNQTIKFGLEKVLGRVSRSRYCYYLDSVMLRVWIFNGKLRKKAFDYLGNLEYGEIVTEEEREEGRISSRSWGDIIFILKEGLYFSPNFRVTRPPKAMHGYHPKLASQKGIFLYDGHYKMSLQHTIRTVEVFNIIKEFLTVEGNF